MKFWKSWRLADQGVWKHPAYDRIEMDLNEGLGLVRNQFAETAPGDAVFDGRHGSDVVAKWINGHCAVGDTFKERIGGVQKTGVCCHDKLFTRPPRADPRVHHRTLSHVLRVVWESNPTLRKTTLSPSSYCAKRSVIPELGCSGSVQSSVGHIVVGMIVDSAVPRVDHFCASLRMPRRWSLCLEGLYRKRRSAPFLRLCSARLPAIVHSSALVRRVSASASGVHSRRSSVATLRSCRRCVWPCASWSVGTSRRSHVRID